MYVCGERLKDCKFNIKSPLKSASVQFLYQAPFAGQLGLLNFIQTLFKTTTRYLPQNPRSFIAHRIPNSASAEENFSPSNWQQPNKLY